MADCTCFAHNGFLTRRGLEVVRLRGLTGPRKSVTVDRVLSVSALDEDEDPIALASLDQSFCKKVPHGS